MEAKIFYVFVRQIAWLEYAALTEKRRTIWWQRSDQFLASELKNTKRLKNHTARAPPLKRDFSTHFQRVAKEVDRQFGLIRDGTTVLKRCLGPQKSSRKMFLVIQIFL